jgi:hypothetical protein
MKKLLSVFALIFALHVIYPTASFSQCAMCKATLESNAKDDKSKIGAGLNTGILYLMVIPYIIFGVLGYLWYKNSRKQAVVNEVFVDKA